MQQAHKAKETRSRRRLRRAKHLPVLVHVLHNLDSPNGVGPDLMARVEAMEKMRETPRHLPDSEDREKPSDASMSPVDSGQLRRVLGAYVTGVTVVTTVDPEGRPHGLTVNSFSSVSLDPPLVLWSQTASAPSHAVFRSSPWFAINILAEDQGALCTRFSTPLADKFADVAWKPGLGRVPILEGCLASLECRVATIFPGGDHKIFLGQVEHIVHSGGNPLLIGNGSLLRSDPLRLRPKAYGVQ